MFAHALIANCHRQNRIPPIANESLSASLKNGFARDDFCTGFVDLWSVTNRI